MAAHSEPLPAKKRLDSWKEIAAFFDRDERTVKRWEKERALPVYRVPGSVRGGVFAYADELAEWLQAPHHNWEPVEIPARVAASVDGNRSPTIPVHVVTVNPPADFPVPDIRLVPPPSPVSSTRDFLWILPLVLITGSFLALSFGHREPRYKNALAAPQPPSAEAQDLYLKGRYHFEKRTPDDLNQAVDFFTQAIVHDPSYAAPYVGLADSYNLLREFSVLPAQEAFPRARAAAAKAVELDPNSAEAYNSLAFASFWGFFDVATAEREFKRAIELNPGLPRAHHWYATFLIETERTQEALAEIERARQLDPSSTAILADKGCILAAAGKAEEARTLLTQLATSQPEFVPPHRYLAEDIYFREGNYAGYFTESATVARLRHDAKAQKNIDLEKAAYASGGRRGLLEQRLTTRRESFDHGTGSAFDVADAYAALGQDSDALKYLEIAWQRHDLRITTLLTNGEFQHLHQNQEFREVAAKVGLPPVP
ncbi:MAG: tetratricopeptide repeat protein [Candidatus Sulfotelmatobacter sp.]